MHKIIPNLEAGCALRGNRTFKIIQLHNRLNNLLISFTMPSMSRQKRVFIGFAALLAIASSSPHARPAVPRAKNRIIKGRLLPNG